jgi:hypothetical protein
MTRKIRFHLLLIAVLGFVVACNPDDDSPTPDSSEPKLLITFEPNFNGQEVHIGDRFVNAHGCTVELTNMKFYISNLKLYRSSGDIDQLSDIGLIDIKNHKRTLDFEIPAGDYTGVSFDLGVPQELNGTANPAFLVSVYSPNHPLSESNGMYWAWQSGYRFFIFEGRFDTVPDATYTLPSTFAFHSGLDTLFREVGFFSRTFTASAGQTKHLMFSVDIEKIFVNDNDVINLWYEREFHGSLSQLDLGIRYANNTAASFNLLP